MLGLWLEEGQLRLRDDLPRPRAEGEALVRVVRAGICNTDLELVRGYYPFTGVLGHEFVGIVEQGPEELVGERVVGEINAVCDDCRHCTEGRSSHCSNRTVLGIVGRDGTFAEHLCLPAANLHRVPDDVATDLATFTEPLAAALEIQEQIQVRPDDRVAVIGDGKLGLLVALTLAQCGCELWIVGRHRAKLELLERTGARLVLPGDEMPRELDTAVECTGNPEGFALAQSSLRPRGTLVMKSTYAGQLTIDVAPIVVDELRLVGSRCGPFAPALRLLSERRIDPEPLISDRFALSDGVRAFERAREPGVLKVLLDVEA